MILSMIAAPVTSMRRVSSVLHPKSELLFAEEDYWRENSCRNVSSSQLFRFAVPMRMERRPSINSPETARYLTPKEPQKHGQNNCTSLRNRTNPTAGFFTPKKMKSNLDHFSIYEVFQTIRIRKARARR